MAKVKGPLFSITAIGTVDNKLIYRNRKGLDDVKRYAKTVNPNSPGQQAQKGYFKNAIDAWSVDGYSVADKFAWDKFAKTKKVITSGFNRFTSLKITAEKKGFTWTKLKNCTIYDVTGAGFKVDIDVSSDLSGILYLGTSKYSMLTEFIGVFSVNKYTFTITGLPDETKVYFYIKNTSVGEGARTGIYSQYHVGGWVPMPIDIGSPAINRPQSWYPGGHCVVVNKDNPADGNGKIESIQIHCATSLYNCKVATFFVVSGNNLSTRDQQYIGNVPQGATRTFPVDIDVNIGDYLGIYFFNRKLDTTNIGYAGCWYIYSDQIPCSNVLFSLLSGRTASLYGTGETT